MIFFCFPSFSSFFPFFLMFCCSIFFLLRFVHHLFVIILTYRGYDVKWTNNNKYRPRKWGHDTDIETNLGSRTSTTAGYESNQDSSEWGTSITQLFTTIVNGPSRRIEFDAKLLEARRWNEPMPVTLVRSNTKNSKNERHESKTTKKNNNNDYNDDWQTPLNLTVEFDDNNSCVVFECLANLE